MWTSSFCRRPVKFATTTLTTVVLFFSVIGYVRIQSPLHVLPKRFPDMHSGRSLTACGDEISTTKDTRYILYGDGKADDRTTKRLRNYIRSMTSKQAGGAVRLRDKSAEQRDQHFSQIGESEFVDNLLQGRRGGFFVECGAADGEQLSNSLFFELHRNWTGLLIEANPGFHRALLSKNRRAYVVRACLSSTTKPETVKFKLSGLGSGMANRMHNSAFVDFDIEHKPVVDVQCFPLNSIAAALGVHHIDYLSLDVEGPEVEILRTVDWTQLTVDVLTVEYGRKVDKLDRLRSLLLNSTGLFTEVGILPVGSTDSVGQDVVFMRAKK